MTCAAIHRIKTAPVSALVGANVAVETLCLAVYGSLKLRQVGFMAIEAGGILVQVVCIQSEW